MEIVIPNFNKGDFAFCVAEKVNHPRLEALRMFVLEVEETKKDGSLDLLKFKGLEEAFWAGWFRKFDVGPKFRLGDKVRYKSTLHSHLIGKTLTVAAVLHFNSKDFLIRFQDVPNMYAQDNFEKSDDAYYPHIREVLTDLCNKDIVTQGVGVHFHVINNRAKEVSYTRNDLMTVLRALEEFHVPAEINFRSTMDDALTFTIDGESIMEELGSNAPKTLPIEAVLKLCDILDITMQVEGQHTVLEICYGGIIYYGYDKETVSAV